MTRTFDVVKTRKV